MAAAETTHRVQRFRFASFDEPVKAAAKAAPVDTQPPPVIPEELPLPRIEPSITDKDLQAARAEARTLGYREGYGAAETKMKKEESAREEAIRSVMEVIANRVTIAAETHAGYLRQQQALMEKLVIATARKVAGDALRRDPYAAAASLLKECMALIAGEPKVTIYASAAVAAGLAQRIDGIKATLQGFEGELAVVEDGSLFDQDCRVEWKNGYGERNRDQIWNDIEAIIARTPINPA